MSMPTASFTPSGGSEHMLGDVFLGLVVHQTSRELIEQTVSAIDGITIRNRGGGRHAMQLRCNYLATTHLSAQDYVRSLKSTCGNTEGTITLYNSAGSSVAYAGCYIVDIQADTMQSVGKFVVFTVSVVRSQAGSVT